MNNCKQTHQPHGGQMVVAVFNLVFGLLIA